MNITVSVKVVLINGNEFTKHDVEINQGNDTLTIIESRREWTVIPMFSILYYDVIAND